MKKVKESRTYVGVERFRSRHVDVDLFDDSKRLVSRDF